MKKTHAEELPAPLDSGLDVIGSAPPPLPSYEQIEDSDVFLSAASVPSEIPPSPITGTATEERRRISKLMPKVTKPVTKSVTLFVYGWHNVEPGPLSWVFPSLRAALDSVQRMKNAIGWCIVSGDTWSDLADARKADAVLVEQE